MYSARDADRVMNASIVVQKVMDEDDRIGFFLSAYSDFLIAGMLYRQWSDFPPVFHAFDDIEPLAVPVPETNGTQFSAAGAASMSTKAK